MGFLIIKTQAQSFQNPLITADTIIYIGIAKAGNLPEFLYGEKKFEFYT